MGTQLRWAICGTGRVSSDFIQALKLFPDDHKIVAVGATTLERAESCVSKHGLQHAVACASHAQAYSHKDADAVYIGVINSEHMKLTLGALKQAKHVLCEKPMGLNLNQVQQMIHAAKISGKLLLENAWTLHFPAFKEIKEKIHKGEVGDIQIVNAQCGYIDHEEIKHDPSKGGGFLYGPGYYLPLIALDIYDWQMPIAIKTTGILSPRGCDRTASICLEFSGGKIAHLLYTATADIKCSAEIIGSDGIIDIPKNVWCPTTFHLNTDNITKYSLPENSQPTNYNFPNSAGFCYIQKHFKKMIDLNRNHSDVFPLAHSELLVKVLDIIRNQLGVKFNVDQ